MNRRALKVLVVALLAAGAIVAAAGTVDDVRTGGSGAPSAPDADRTETSTTTPEPTESTATPREQTTVSPGASQDCLEFMTHPLVVFAILLAWGGVVYWIYRRNGPVEATAAFLCILVVMFLAYPALAICNPSGEPQTPNQSGEPPEIPNRTDGDGTGGVGEGSGSDTPGTPDLPLVVLAIVAILAVAAIGGVLVTRGEDDDELDVFDEDAEELPDESGVADVDEVAAAAGRAADRIEDDADLDNEIYRAWVEMTEHLDVDHPESSTPGEFARAALAAGIDRDDVTELTELFERVRYGSDEPTPDREDRALDALRRIERQYGDDGERRYGDDGERQYGEDES